MICVNIFINVLLTFLSHLNMSFVQIPSVLEGLGLVVLVVDQLSPCRDLAPAQELLRLFYFSTLSDARHPWEAGKKVHANRSSRSEADTLIMNWTLCTLVNWGEAWEQRLTLTPTPVPKSSHQGQGSY